MPKGTAVRQKGSEERIVATASEDAGFEAIGVRDIESRIRLEFPTLKSGTVQALADAVAALVPAPPGLADPVARTLSPMETIFDFVHRSRPTEETRQQWTGLKDDLLAVMGTLQALRDRIQRTCRHQKLRETRYGGRECPTCGAGWSHPVENPGPMFGPRTHFLAAKNQKLPGRGLFVYFTAALVEKLEGIKLAAAQKISGRLMWMFWNDGKAIPISATALKSAYEAGKRSARANHVLTPEEFLQYGRIRLGAPSVVWVPLRRPKTVDV